MGQLNVRFSFESQSGHSSFSSLAEINDPALSQIIGERLMDFEIRLKQAAARYWLEQKLGPEQVRHVSIQLDWELFS